MEKAVQLLSELRLCSWLISTKKHLATHSHMVLLFLGIPQNFMLCGEYEGNMRGVCGVYVGNIRGREDTRGI